MLVALVKTADYATVIPRMALRQNHRLRDALRSYYCP